MPTQLERDTLLTPLWVAESVVQDVGREKAVLQNAITATDQQIDALVYELYNLTPEEIQLVE